MRHVVFGVLFVRYLDMTDICFDTVYISVYDCNIFRL